MNLEELERELALRGPRRAYLLLGEEPLLRDDALAALRSAALAGADPEFNLDRFDGSASAGALVDALQTLPVQVARSEAKPSEDHQTVARSEAKPSEDHQTVARSEAKPSEDQRFAARRLVVLFEPEGRRGQALVDAVADWVGRAPEGDTSTLVVAASRPDRRARWVKAFGDAVVSCEAPVRASELSAFAREEAARQGVTLERGAAEALAERIGAQLLMLRQEIAKLALLAGPGETVSRAHVEVGTPLAAEEPVWDLTDAIGEGRGAEALRVLGRLLGAGAPPPVILGALVSHFRRLLRCAAGGEVSGPPFVRKKLASQAQRYGVARLRAALGALHETDLALKGAGALRPELALERLVIALGA